MGQRRYFLIAGLATLIAGALVNPTQAGAQDASSPIDERIAQGLAIAPVPLNLTGKDKDMVGLGSYLVNAVGGCNDCHTNPSYLPGSDPSRGQPKKVNAAGYLGGGQAFGPFISRNITPDYTKVPEGGHTFDEFLLIMRTGVDMDKAHPAISPLLQVMPWPDFQDMKDRDLRAVYEYLSTIPCVEGGPGEPAHRCAARAPVPTIALSPRNLTTGAKTLMLDASGSKAADGGAVSFVWENYLGGPYVTFSDPNSPTPTVTFTGGPGTYVVLLSVIDRSGVASSMAVKINYTGS